MLLFCFQMLYKLTCINLSIKKVLFDWICGHICFLLYFLMVTAIKSKFCVKLTFSFEMTSLRPPSPAAAETAELFTRSVSPSLPSRQI